MIKGWRWLPFQRKDREEKALLLLSLDTLRDLELTVFLRQD
jgi:hypothetical protein